MAVVLVEDAADGRPTLPFTLISNLLELPEELLPIKSRHAAARTCRAWSRILAKPQSWRRLVVDLGPRSNLSLPFLLAFLGPVDATAPEVPPPFPSGPQLPLVPASLSFSVTCGPSLPRGTGRGALLSTLDLGPFATVLTHDASLDALTRALPTLTSLRRLRAGLVDAAGLAALWGARPPGLESLVADVAQPLSTSADMAHLHTAVEAMVDPRVQVCTFRLTCAPEAQTARGLAWLSGVYRRAIDSASHGGMQMHPPVSDRLTVEGALGRGPTPNAALARFAESMGAAARAGGAPSALVMTGFRGGDDTAAAVAAMLGPVAASVMDSSCNALGRWRDPHRGSLRELTISDHRFSAAGVAAIATALAAAAASAPEFAAGARVSTLCLMGPHSDAGLTALDALAMLLTPPGAANDSAVGLMSLTVGLAPRAGAATAAAAVAAEDAFCAAVAYDVHLRHLTVEGLIAAGGRPGALLTAIAGRDLDHPLATLTMAGGSLDLDGDAAALGGAAARVTSLTLLDPQRAFAMGDGCGWPSFLGDNKALRSLVLEGTVVCDADACHLAAALRRNTALTSLTLRRCRLGRPSLDAFARALVANATLTTLVVDTGPGDAGAARDASAAAIAAAMAANADPVLRARKSEALRCADATLVGNAAQALAVPGGVDAVLAVLALAAHRGIVAAGECDAVRRLVAVLRGGS